MSVSELFKDTRLPVLAAPLFIISYPELVIAQCKAGVIGSFPALNARPAEELEKWIIKISSELEKYKKEVLATVSDDTPQDDINYIMEDLKQKLLLHLKI